MNFFKRIPKFFLEVKDELKKVTWSTRKELTSAALLVVVVTAMLTVYIAAVDFLITFLIQPILK